MLLRRVSLLLAPGILALAPGGFAEEPTSSATSGDGRDDARKPLAVQVVEKTASLLEVVAELRIRSTQGMTPEQISARTKNLDRLEVYARAGRFTVNDQFPFDMPFFVDARGTRCAVAHLVDLSGQGAMVENLARVNNNAHIAELMDMGDLLAWVEANGLRVEEIAYIQGPGVRGGDGGMMGGGPPEDPSDSEVAPPMDLPPVDTAPVAGDPVGPTGGRPPNAGGAGVPGQPRSGGAASMLGRRAKASSNAFRWTDWWRFHRDEYANIRARYHRAPTTGVNAEQRAFAPAPSDIAADVVPVLQKLLTEDSRISTTAAVGLAVGAPKALRPEIHDQLAALAESVRGPDQAYAILSLGLLPGGAGVASLQGIAQDSKVGRRSIKRSGSIPARFRSYACMALALSGGRDSIQILQAVVDTASSTDLQRSAVLALGILAAQHSPSREVTQFLLTALRDDATDRRLRPVLPFAMIPAKSTATVPALVEVVAKFRGPNELRMACATALGKVGAPLDAELIDALIAVARRDTDADSRGAAVLALAELAARASTELRGRTEEQDAALSEVRKFFTYGLQGEYRHDSDLPWYALGSGIVAREYPKDCAALVRGLRLVLREASRDAKAAAIIGLALAGGADARDDLLQVVNAAKDPYLLGCAAEAVGMLDDHRARERLVELVSDAPGEFVRYHAARGLALVAEQSALLSLHSALEACTSDAARIGLIQAIGEIGDKRSIPMLARMAQDSKSDVMTRARAVGALGMLIRPSDRSWAAPLHGLVHPNLASPAVQELMQVF